MAKYEISKYGLDFESGLRYYSRLVSALSKIGASEIRINLASYGDFRGWVKVVTRDTELRLLLDAVTEKEGLKNMGIAELPDLLNQS